MVFSNNPPSIRPAGDVRQFLRAGPEHIESFTRIEQRTVAELIRSMTSVQLPDGRTQLALPGEKPLPNFPAKRLWGPKEVGVMRRQMIEFYESPFGLLSAFELMSRGDFFQSPSSLGAGEMAPIYAAEMQRIWSATDLLLVAADEPFVDMMEAAALSAPTGPLSRDELLSDRGVIFFQKERRVPKIHTGIPIRGVLWYLSGQLINVQVLIDGRHVLNMPGDHSVEPPAELHSHLYVINLLRTKVAQPDATGEGAYEALGFLRSIAAIAKSAQTRSENKVVEHREKKGGRVRNIHKETIRTLSLHNAEYGRYELDGATGRKLRRHWVRGHWRNQWYPGEQINKTIWIDGFVRGDAALGTVTGQKVYVARAPKEDGVAV